MVPEKRPTFGNLLQKSLTDSCNELDYVLNRFIVWCQKICSTGAGIQGEYAWMDVECPICKLSANSKASMPWQQHQQTSLTCRAWTLQTSSPHQDCHSRFAFSARNIKLYQWQGFDDSSSLAFSLDLEQFLPHKETHVLKSGCSCYVHVFMTQACSNIKQTLQAKELHVHSNLMQHLKHVPNLLWVERLSDAALAQALMHTFSRRRPVDKAYTV